MQNELICGTNEFNPSYTFESLVEGKHNQFVLKAALSIAECNGPDYSPLFIFSSEGLGKTHILHAVGNELKKRFPAMVVRYLSAPDFARQYVDLIMKNISVSDYLNGFNDLDVLLIDNIEQLNERPAKQGQLLDVFNRLSDFGKQVIIASNSEPTKITHIAYSLRTRFEHGLMAEIGFPDFDTRMVLLRKKVDEKKLQLPEELLLLIGETCTAHSVGQLAGALITLNEHYMWTKGHLTLEEAKKILALYAPSC